MAIEVHPSGDIVIVAPNTATIAEIKSKIEKRSAWITKQLRFFKAYPFNQTKPEWVSGETIYYLGRQYRLKIIKGEDAVKLQGKFLHVWLYEKDNIEKIRTLIEDWYHLRATKIFKERIKRIQHILNQERIKINKLIIRKIEKRWGSCTKKGNIVLNTMLVKTPVYCIDYVLTHEICHLKYHDHGPKFWKMLQKYSPDWPKVKQRLEHGSWNR